MGIFDRKKTYTDMSFIGLIEPDVAIKAARRQTMFSTDGLAEYNKKYWTWKHNYRTRYSIRKLEKYGFSPDTGGASFEAKTEDINNYMLGIDPAYDHQVNLKIGIVSLKTQVEYFLQNNPFDYSIKTEKLNVNGGTYDYSYTTYLEDDDPYTPDDRSIIVGHFTGSHESTYEVQVPNTYENERMFQLAYSRDEAETEIYLYLAYKSEIPADIYDTESYTFTPIIPLKEDGKIIGESKSQTKMMRQLGVSPDDFEELLKETDEDGEASIDDAYMMNSLSTLNPYEIEPRTYSAYETEVLSAAFLQYMDKHDNSESESDSEDGTYTVSQEVSDDWYNDHLKEQNYLARALFKTFAYYANGIDMDVYNSEKKSIFYMGNAFPDRTSTHRGDTPSDKYAKIIKTRHPWVASDVNLTISQGGLDMRYGFDISIETKQGTVRPEEKNKRKQGYLHYSGRMHSLQDPDDNGDRDYWSTHDSKGYDEIVIRVQKNESEYQEMIITGYRADFNMGKYGWAVGAGAPLSKNKVVLPYIVINDARFTEYVTISDHSFTLFAYSIKVVKTSLWKMFIGLVISILICFGTLGTGCGLVALIIKWAISVVVQMIISKIVEMLDSEIFALIANIVLSMYNMMSGNIDFTQFTVENYLMLANQVSSIVMNTIQVLEFEDIANEARKERRDESIENINNKIENVESSLNINVSMSAHYSFSDQNSPDAFYNQMLGAALFNFDQFYNVDREIELRKQVVSG